MVDKRYRKRSSPNSGGEVAVGGEVGEGHGDGDDMMMVRCRKLEGEGGRWTRIDKAPNSAKDNALRNTAGQNLVQSNTAHKASTQTM